METGRQQKRQIKNTIPGFDVTPRDVDGVAIGRCLDELSHHFKYYPFGLDNCEARSNISSLIEYVLEGVDVCRPASRIKDDEIGSLIGEADDGYGSMSPVAPVVSMSISTGQALLWVGGNLVAELAQTCFSLLDSLLQLIDRVDYVLLSVIITFREAFFQLVKFSCDRVEFPARG